MLLGRLGQVKVKQYLFMLGAEKNFGKNWPCKLAITEVVKEDSGVYSCEAHNKLGFVALSSLKINVKGKLVLLLCLKKHETLLIKKYISE